MLNMLTKIIGLWASGHDAKARGPLPLSLIVGWFLGPEVLEAFRIGVQEGGMLPAAHLLGSVLGALAYSGVQYLLSYWSPANKG